MSDRIYVRLKQKEIPDYMRPGILRYVMYGQKPGDFLTAVVENDFAQAFFRADDTNRMILDRYASLLFDVIPYEAVGKENSLRWRELGGKVGITTKTTERGGDAGLGGKRRSERGGTEMENSND